MKRSKVLLVLSLVLVLALTVPLGTAFGKGTPAKGDPKVNPDPGQVPEALAPNLSFPVLFTTPVAVATPLLVDGSVDALLPYQMFFQMEQAYVQVPIYAEDGVTIIGWEDGTELAFTTSGNPVLIFSTDENGDYILTPIAEADYNFSVTYTGTYPTMENFTKTVYESCTEVQATDPATGGLLYDPITGEPIMVWECVTTDWIYKDYLLEYAPWYVQTTDAEYNKKGINIWQAEYKLWEPDPEVLPCENVVDIDFIDWGNPMENTNPMVGYRFPVEIALYEKFDEDTLMKAYKAACLEYNSSRDEFFGVKNETWDSYYATVLTSQFEAWVIGPGGVRTDIILEPAIGPSGKMNFASAGGGWMPTVPGWHTFYLRILDPNISLKNAIINDDDSYCMKCGVMCKELPKWKLEKTGIYYNDTWLTLYVEPNTSGRKK